MATVKFIKKSENGCIYVRAKKGRSIDLTVSTGLNLPIKDWDEKKGFPKQNIKDGLRYKHALNIKQKLWELQSKIENELNASMSKNGFDKEWLVNIINPNSHIPEEKMSIQDMVLQDYISKFYITDPNKNLKDGSVKHAKTIQSLLDRFYDKTKYDLKLKNINRHFISGFKSWMNSMKFSLGYTSRTLKAIKGYCKHAYANHDILENKDVLNIKVKFEPTDFVVLSLDEIQKIKQTQMPHEYLENAKRWLLISCFTGQRVSDFLKFNKNKLMYEEGIKKDVILISQKKTGSFLKLPVNDYLLEVLKSSDFCFPRRISEQKYNEYIKEVCKIAQIDCLVNGSKHNPQTKRKQKGVYPKYELVTSHIGRRSFATMFYGIIATEILMYATGHKSVMSFLKYINKSENDKMIELNRQFEKINKENIWKM